MPSLPVFLFPWRALWGEKVPENAPAACREDRHSPSSTCPALRHVRCTGCGVRVGRPVDGLRSVGEPQWDASEALRAASSCPGFDSSLRSLFRPSLADRSRPLEDASRWRP